MNVLKKLATPFIAIWRWIKETAWVQPLLIVGIIFGIIFSIPSITSWVQSWDFGDDTYTWLKNNQLSLKGITDTKQEGEVITFFEKFEEAQNLWNEKADDSKSKARNALKDYTNDKGKMFLYFVQENEAAKNINDANKLLADKLWDEKIVKPSENKEGSFKCKTIFTDEKIDLGEKDHTYDEHSAYDFFRLASGKFAAFHGYVENVWDNTPYYRNIVGNKVDGVTLDSYKSSVDTFFDAKTTPNSPALFVIDLTDSNATDSIITNITFTVAGNNEYDRANYLAEAWLGNEVFGTIA